MKQLSVGLPASEQRGSGDPTPTARDVTALIRRMLADGRVEFNAARGRLVHTHIPGRPALFVGDQREIRCACMALGFRAPARNVVRNAIDIVEGELRAANPIRITPRNHATENRSCSISL